MTNNQVRFSSRLCTRRPSSFVLQTRSIRRMLTCWRMANGRPMQRRDTVYAIELLRPMFPAKRPYQSPKAVRRVKQNAAMRRAKFRQMVGDMQPAFFTPVPIRIVRKSTAFRNHRHPNGLWLYRHGSRKCSQVRQRGAKQRGALQKLSPLRKRHVSCD